jgi:hypothetical protein
MIIWEHVWIQAYSLTDPSNPEVVRHMTNWEHVWIQAYSPTDPSNPEVVRHIEEPVNLIEKDATGHELVKDQ